jgi:hypothetical protein
LAKQNVVLGILTEEQFRAILNDPSLKVFDQPPLQDLIRKSDRERGIDLDRADRTKAPPDS